MWRYRQCVENLQEAPKLNCQIKKKVIMWCNHINGHYLMIRWEILNAEHKKFMISKTVILDNSTFYLKLQPFNMVEIDSRPQTTFEFVWRGTLHPWQMLVVKTIVVRKSLGPKGLYEFESRLRYKWLFKVWWGTKCYVALMMTIYGSCV